MTRIPITMSHGMSRGPYFMPKPRWRELPPLDVGLFEGLMRIAAELGCNSIGYDEVAAWRERSSILPSRPIMLDLDHPNLSIHREVWPVLRKYRYRGNIFINTAAMERESHGRFMSWDDLRQLRDDGWQIGAHLHNHVSLAYLARKDPTGGLIREQMDTCDRVIEEHLGVVPRDFAYTTTTWSAPAEREVAKRYRFARLWCVSSHLATDAGRVRYADLAGVSGEDETDGGPPLASRYITERTHTHRLPSMDFEYQIYEYGAFRGYLEGALGEVAEADQP
jgi:peptidoglycan/xylan/chitin deacetylase (PgdA/CDA1 family)